MYNAAGAASGPQPGADAGQGQPNASGKDEVTDVDYEEVGK
jgi:hypothetical protein